MSDVKISGLPASTTPLAGTEVLPIVQGGQTRQVSVNNLTAGKAVSASSITVGAGAVGTPSITTANDTNTGIFFPAADTIAFAEGGAEAMRIDAEGDIGLGTNAPAVSGMEITRATGSSNPTPAELRISTSTNAADWSTTLPWGRISFYNADASIAGAKVTGAIQATADATSGGTNRLEFMSLSETGTLQKMMQLRRDSSISMYTSGIEQLTIDTNVTVKTGNLVIGTSGKGIDFSATPGTGTSELFNDYEEGTFNAQVTDSSTPVNNAVMSSITCRYTKVGRLVTIEGNVSTSSVVGLSGSIRIGGLPFAIGAFASGPIGFASGLNITAGYSATVVANPGNSYIGVQLWDVTTGTTAMTIAEWSDDGNIVFSLTYTV